MRSHMQRRLHITLLSARRMQSMGLTRAWTRMEIASFLLTTSSKQSTIIQEICDWTARAHTTEHVRRQTRVVVLDWRAGVACARRRDNTRGRNRAAVLR